MPKGYLIPLLTLIKSKLGFYKKSYFEMIRLYSGVFKPGVTFVSGIIQVKRQKVKVKDGGKWAYFLGWFQSRNLLVRLSLQRLRSKGQGHKKFMRYTFFEYKLCLYCRIFTFEEKVSFLWDLTPSLIVATENIYTPFKQVL